MKELELYIHIPFCVRKCAYCDFLSGPAGGPEREEYLEALVKEIRSVGDMGRGCQVSSVFLGGGTPSILTPEQIGGILYAVRETFTLAKDAEITMEYNPGTGESERMADYLKTGVNRLSIGLQSADDGELRILGRIHTWKEFLKTYEEARKAGCDNINIDLMSAIPGQTLNSYERTLEKICRLLPDHVSAYSLILEEGPPFGNWYEKSPHPAGHPPLPDEETERQMYERTKEILHGYGYERYEISNYAKEGKMCRHNIGYWKRVPYLGFGVGAASLWKEKRWSNIRDRRQYVALWKEHKPREASRMIRENMQMISVREAQEETFFLGLRMMEGVSESRFEDTFGCAIEDVYGKELKKLEADGFVQREGGRIFLTDRGIDISNTVMTWFLQDEEEEE